MFSHHHDHDHSPEGIAERLSRGPRALYLREWVYGGIDGVVTTFAIVSAVIGADLSHTIVLALGLANLVGDGFSMAAGAYTSTKADSDNYHRLRHIEMTHIQKYPEGEREETRQIFNSKGFAGEDAEQMTDMITRDENLWIEFMLQEEYGVSRPFYKPLNAGANTFMAFILCGAMPLIPYAVGLPQTPYIALAFAAATFFAIGSFKSLWSVKRWWREGTEAPAIGVSAAGLAFLIGMAFRNLSV
ncbi:MAG: VIT1/CCC1 transporter family protein [Alphaproteobacteria bacterium]|nr:VIT1/CCC1 transporter family protein [Alphaproteobacteria bacterium]